MPKGNLRYNSISNAAGNTAAEISKGVKTLTTPLVYTLGSMKNSLTKALESNSRSETKILVLMVLLQKAEKENQKKENRENIEKPPRNN